MLSTASGAVSRMLTSEMFKRALAPGLPASLPPVANNTQPGAAISLEPPSHDQVNASGITPHINSPLLFALAMSRQRPGATLPKANPPALRQSPPPPVVIPIPPPQSGGVTIPHHYSHIRIAELAYGGVPLGPFGKTLLQNSVDLVIPHTGFLDDIQQIAPKTPALVYSNVSSLYFDLMTDWLRYADAHAINREAAFYHVSQATSFSGTSASSQPVTWFWGV